ncbi:leucine-rich repeat domain-containing protein [Pseudoruminococcus massiliensis]|uniref:leucine-rich repeat domain-containing protein n=1 Tax=Pseudoruminococcus massiliensis TaxID=2086583 RepID=UPI003FD70859
MKSSKKQKILAVMLAASMVSGIGAVGLTIGNISNISVKAADSLTTADGFSYEVIDNTNTVRITGYSKNGKIAIPSKIDGKTVVEIGSNAFRDKTGLQSVSIPETVKIIDGGAFSGCTGLQEVTMLNGLETIGGESFYRCTALKEIKIPDSVTEIGNSAFYNCSAAKTLTIGKSVKTIGSDAFEKCESIIDVTLPDSLTKIGTSVFGNCKKLETVVMKGENLVTIPYATFYDCKNLRDVYIGAGITTIGSSAFNGCTSLDKITVPDSVTKIENSAFSNCTSLKKIIIPESVTVIEGNDVFENHGKDLVIYGYSNDCEAKKYADANNITYKLINAHDHQPGEWIIIKEATEKNSGTKIQKCTICGELLNVEIIDIIHTHTYGDKWQSDETNHWHECTVCGEKADTAKHEFGEWETDEKTAKQHRECTICGYTEEKAKPHEHSYGDDWYSDETNHWHECTVCGEKADTAEHEFGEWVIDEKTSTKHRACTVCEYPQSEIIPHIHTYGEEWKSDETNHWHECTICGDKSDTAKHDLKDVIDKEATATETGLKHKECTVCGYKGLSEVISKLDPTPTPTPPQPTPTPGKVVNTGDNAVPITIASVLGLGAITAFVISFKKKHS